MKAGECIKQIAPSPGTECYCNTDLCNTECTATDCKPAVAKIVMENHNGTDTGGRTFERCTATCAGGTGTGTGNSTANSEIASSIMILATQAMAGFLIL